MDFQNIIPNVLWEPLDKFEMIIMNMEYPKKNQGHVTNALKIFFYYLKDFLKGFKSLENKKLMGNVLSPHSHNN